MSENVNLNTCIGHIRHLYTEILRGKIQTTNERQSYRQMKIQSNDNFVETIAESVGNWAGIILSVCAPFTKNPLAVSINGYNL